MDTTLLEIATQLPLHSLLLIAVVVLWRDNKAMRDKLETVRQTSAGNTALLLGQNSELQVIKDHIAGQTPPKGIKVKEEPYTAMPPYRSMPANKPAE